MEWNETLELLIKKLRQEIQTSMDDPKVLAELLPIYDLASTIYSKEVIAKWAKVRNRCV